MYVHIYICASPHVAFKEDLVYGVSPSTATLLRAEKQLMQLCQGTGYK